MGLLDEGDEIADVFKGSPAINAALKVEHYEIASYGCFHECAGLLGKQESAGLLESILAEEKGANEALTELARSSSNTEALGESDEALTENGAVDEGPGHRRGGNRTVSSGRKVAHSMKA